MANSSWPRLACVWTIAFVAWSCFLSHPSEFYRWWLGSSSYYEPVTVSLLPPRTHRGSSSSGAWNTSPRDPRRTQNAFFFSLSETFQGHVCVYWVYKAHFHSISLSLCSFNRIIIVPSFIKCDRLVSASFLEPCCPEISAHRPLEHKTDWADVSDTLRDASPADSVCRIWCERLNWDSLLLLLLLLELPEKLAPLFLAISIKAAILFIRKVHINHSAPKCTRFSLILVETARAEKNGRCFK